MAVDREGGESNRFGKLGRNGVEQGIDRGFAKLQAHPDHDAGHAQGSEGIGFA